ncbi:MAG: class II aldolase/adducin family protein [Terriglobales bacterium]
MAAQADRAAATRDILRIGQFLHQKSLVAASDGNISVRLEGGRVLTTPTSMSKGLMEADDLVVTDMQGHKLEGRRNASSELAMHLLIYELRPEVNGVVHAHPPAATGFAAAGIPLNQALLAEVVLALGCIPLAAYGTTGTPELSATLRPLVPHYDAILMANHGVVCYGEDVMKAYFKMETVEHFARIAIVTHVLGRQNLLGQEEVAKLMQARQRYEGVTSAAALTADCPVTAPMEPRTPLAARNAENGAGNRKRRW